MSSTTPTNVHSVAAQQITVLAARSEEEKILEEALQNALPRCSHLNISAQTIDRFRTTRTDEDFLRIFDELRAANQVFKTIERGSRRDRVTRFAENVLCIKDYGIALGQFNQSIATPVFGLVFATLTSLQNLSVTDETLNILSNRLKQWAKRYALLYDSDGALTVHIRSELIEFHEVAIEFAMEVASVFELTVSRAAFLASSKKLVSELSRFSKRLSNAASDVDAGVMYETYRAFNDFTLSQALPQPTPALASPAPQAVPMTLAPSGSHTIPTTRRYCFPNTLTRTFAGRSNVLNAIYDSFNLNHVVTTPSRVAIHGIAGVGKSQTALQFAGNNRVASSSGIYSSILFVRAKDQTTLLAEFCRLAAELGLLKRIDVGMKHKDAVVTAVKHWLETASSWLLIFDNVVQTSDVLEYLPASGDGHILFTTRSDIVARSLSSHADTIEVKPLNSQTEGIELVLKLAPVVSPPSERDLKAARDIATFANGLPLVIEQIITFSTQSSLSWHEVLSMVSDKTKILKRDAVISCREEEWSAWAILDTVLKYLEKKSPKAAELFKILVYLDTSSISRALLHNAKENINNHLQRSTTYERGSRTPSQQSRRNRSQERLSLFDFDPFSRELVRWVFRRGEFSKKCTDTQLPRADSSADIELERLWRSSEKLIQNVFESPANLDNAVNDLTNAGLVRSFGTSNLWIHDLFAQMSRASLELKSRERGGSRAHLAATTVFLTFPIPELPDPWKSVDKCMESLPHAIACHSHLKSLGILNNTTIGPELSHLIASTIETARIKYSSRKNQFHTMAEAIGYYKDAYLGYLASWKRLQQIKGMTSERVLLSTFADYAWEDLSNYLPRRHLDDYERFGGSAPWRCLSTMAKLGSLLSDEGEGEEAVTYLKSAAELSEYVFGPSHIDTSEITRLLMRAYMKQKNWEGAYDAACRKALAFMKPDKTESPDGGEPLVRGLRDTVTGGEMARDIGFCCVEIPGRERDGAEMFQNELDAKRYVWGAESAHCCGAMQRLARAWEKAGDLHKSVFWQGSAVDLAVLDAGKPSFSDLDEKSIKWGTGQCRLLDDNIVADIIATFRRLESQAGNLDPQLEDMVMSWTRSIQVWEMLRELDS